MRILMVLTYYHPHWTGLTAFAQRTAEGLAARGHSVTVLTSRYSRTLAREEVHNGVRIVRVPSWFRLSRGQVMPALVPALRRLIPQHDVVQVHTPMLETWLVSMMAHCAGRQVLMTHHGDLVMPDGLWNQTVQHVVGGLLSWGARAVDRITTHTQDYADHSDFLRPHHDKVVPIYPPVIIPRPRLTAAEQWRRSLSLDGAPLVGFAGRFVEEKGFDYLLQAIPRLAERHPDVRLAFAGEANVVYEAFYRKCLPLIEAHRDRLVTLGLITDRQRMAEFYRMCDVFALPSRTDCMPSVQIEALLCGTPVVATNIPGAREVVRVTGMGLLVEPHNPWALADGLATVLDDPGHYARPYEDIWAIFDPNASICRYEALLGEMAVCHGGGCHG